MTSVAQTFAARYFRDSQRGAAKKRAFADADAVFVLAYAIIMLATSLHSAHIKASERITLKGFLAQVRPGRRVLRRACAA